MLLWTFSTLFLAQIYYLAGVPKSFVKMADLDLRAGLMNYILVPLAALYLVLLYAGLVNVVFLGGLDLYSLHDWTVVFVIFGLLVYFFSSFLMKESALTSLFRKAFFPLVLPLTFVSIYFLVTKEDAVLYADSYYYVQVIAMGLLALFSFYFIVSRQKDLRMLGAFALWFFTLSLLGANYWNVSMKMDRLEGRLVEKGAYVDGEIVPASIAPEELGSEIVILVEGLAGVPGSHLEEFFGESYPKDHVVVDRLQGRLLQVLTGEVGEDYYYEYAVSDADGYFYYTAENYCDLFNGCSIDIDGFDLFSRVQADSTYAQMNDVYYSQGGGVLLTYQLDNFNELSFFDAYGNRLGSFDLSGLRDEVQTNEALSAEKMAAPAPIPDMEPPSDLRIPAEANIFEFDGSGFTAKFLLSSVEGYEGKASYVTGILLVDFL